VFQAAIGVISGLTPTRFMTRVRFYARTDRAISAATFGSVFVRRCVAFEPPARLNPVQIAVNIKLEENQGVVRGPTSGRRLNPFKAHLS